MFDMSNIFFNSVHEYCSREKVDVIEKDLLRSMLLTRINMFNKKFGKDSNTKVFLIFDSRNYWKRNHFPHYKENRKKQKEASAVDWDTIFKYYEEIKIEFKQNLPFYFLEVDGAEADDIFAALCFRYSNQVTDIFMVCSDEDMVQLQLYYNNIKQYSLKRKNYITIENTNYNLFEHIVRGDVGDGIPNILSPANTIITEGVSQTRLYSKDIEKWKYHGINKPEQFCKTNEMLDRYKLNKLLIDFNEIPIELIDKIDEEYINYKIPKGKLFNYMIKHKMTKLMDDMKS